MTLKDLSFKEKDREVQKRAQHSFDEGRKHLNDLEIGDLLKMTNDVLMKIKQQTKEMDDEHL